MLLGLTLVVFAFQASRTAVALREARAEATQAQRQLTAGDLTAARRSLADFRESSATARRASDGLLWDAASNLPVFGGSVEAVQWISSALDGVAKTSLPAALEVVDLAQKGSLQGEDGQVNLVELRRVAPGLVRAADRVQKENRQLAAIESSRLLSPLRKPVIDLKERFGDLDRTVGSAASVVSVLPSMLGGDGARNYVLVAQNTAELRATGGLPGSLSLVTAGDGKLTQGFRGSAADFPKLKSPVLPLAADERDLYGPALGQDIRQTSQTPDFPRAAELISAMVSRRLGVQVDGVIAIDPIGLSRILKVTGPVQAGAESFSADDVVAKVLNQAYQRLPSQNAQDDYFAAASGSIFDAVINARSDVPDLLRGVTAAVRERRILMWSREKSEQEVLEQGRLGGRLPVDSGLVPQVGMYLNDYSAGKINYYLDYGAQLEAVSCSPQRSQTLVARMELASSVPQPVSKLSKYVTGPGLAAKKGTNALFLRIYAPLGGKLTAISVNGGSAKVDAGRHKGREVWTLRLQIAPGQKVEVLAQMETRAGQSGNPVLAWTPGMRREINDFGAESACR